MSEVTNFKNNATGNQFDLVDQEARDSIDELNSAMTDLRPDYVFTRRDALTSENDLNDLAVGGLYRAYSADGYPQNYPSSYDGLILHFHYSTNFKFQAVVVLRNSNIYLRTYMGSSGWQDWVTLTTN